MNLIELKIITPEGIKFAKKIEIFNTVTSNGAIGINANQVNLIAKLKNNISTVKIDNNNKIDFVILNGLLYSTESEIKVFTDFCEEVSKVKVEEIRKKIQLLKASLNNQSDSSITKSINYQIDKLEKIISCFDNKN